MLTIAHSKFLVSGDGHKKADPTDDQDAGLAPPYLSKAVPF